MVNKRHKNRFLPLKLLPKKMFLLYIFVLAVLQPTQIILKNHVLSYQIIMFIRAACGSVGNMIYIFPNLFLNNDCDCVLIDFNRVF